MLYFQHIYIYDDKDDVKMKFKENERWDVNNFN
jgi:hypothetical protein